MMDNLDDSENNAKISDSAYSNSCSNSHSRRSCNSKSTRSGSNSSRSSGYGGKQSTSESSRSNDRQPSLKRPKDKDGKHKSQLADIQAQTEFRLPQPAQPSETKKEEENDASDDTLLLQGETGVQDMQTQEANTGEDTVFSHISSTNSPMQVVVSRNSPPDGFSCVISMHDGIVMYTTSSLTNAIGFPKDMWIGRSFIDFVHPLDRSTFASQITNGLAVPKKDTPPETGLPLDSVSTMFCRIRKYRGLAGSFGIKERTITFIPFTLKLNFKNCEEQSGILVYLVVQATPLCSAFKSAHEILVKAVSFVLRHVSNGNLEYIDPEAVPFLGYFPQDLHGKDVLRFYHPDDLTYMLQIYEIIMKEGTAPRSKPYRFMAQNGDYLKLETEWTSFVNPWSRKLEFVVATHHVLEGPANPDVFQPPVIPTGRERRSAGEERNKAQRLKDNIVRIMNNVLTKPAEFAKQQMSNRCQDLASFMESLIQDTSKVEPEERAVEIPEPANSCERDFEILGGISPHHDYYSEGKSSSETPPSYNQLNFNDNIQRFFDNHQELTYEEYQQAIAGHLEELKDNKPFVRGRLSPMALYSTDSADITSSGESSSGPYVFKKHGDTSSVRLTESLLSRHNTDMEKSLVKKHRDSRLPSKEEREKASYASKQKKKEHLARCNASFVPTSAESTTVDTQQSQGQKRSSKQLGEKVSSRKQHCSETRAQRRQHAGSPEPDVPGPSAAPTSTERKQTKNARVSAPYAAPVSGIYESSSRAPHVHDTTGTAPYYRTQNIPNMVPYGPSMGIASHTAMRNPLPNGTGLIPFLYIPTTAHTVPSTSSATTQHQYPTPPIQYVMYGPAVVGSPIMVAPITAPAYPMQETMLQYASPRDATMMRIATCNYEVTTETILRAPQPSFEPRWKAPEKKNESGSGNETGNSDEAVDRTDGESSYSSFYSSFFKTDSGSADDSCDSKKTQNITGPFSKTGKGKKLARRKIEPPWMEQVCVTPELVYKYQIAAKDENEILAADREKMTALEQPSLVNEQLDQLYKDLQLEGIAARLTLEEGLNTSSCSSGDETKYPKVSHNKRVKSKGDYTKLVMMFEEDAPMPPPQKDEGTSTAAVS